MSTLELKGVTVSRAGARIVRDVSFSVGAGEVTTVLGPNGAGKTTLLEALAGVIGFEGDATLDGQDLSRMSRTARARGGLSLVEQGRTIFASFTVEENLRVVGAAADDIERAYELFPALRERRTTTSTLLSGGEQQMLVLARAIVGRPTVLMIDEMSLGLAPVIVRKLLPTIRKLADEGVAVVLVEQFARLALDVADSALVLAAGAVTYAGPAATLRESPELLHDVYLGTHAAETASEHREDTPR